MKTQFDDNQIHIKIKVTTKKKKVFAMLEKSPGPERSSADLVNSRPQPNERLRTYGRVGALVGCRIWGVGEMGMAPALGRYEGNEKLNYSTIKSNRI
ncbi:hypothetical protein GOBAR_AA05709 [Gossypium barbadense]|uniref:Uncharacterized protein n=1 Tax=Gossypium barbadense TaxID=3634 RepID=A0A2P5YH35_GOSBA|nr:hypothetical protein GOBAR_AA05709 [Gossypium barbadense]